jgi:plastocyanin
MVRHASSLLVAVAVAVGAAGCGVTEDSPDVVAGKRAFVESCGGCHTLQRAGTQGVAGPNLDEAFHRARVDGLGESTIAGVVEQQILYPSSSDQTNPGTGELSPKMPAKIVEGQRAKDVAAYVAAVAGREGEDQGALADIGQQAGGGETATAENGELDLPVVEGGAFRYTAGAAEAPAGALTITSENPQATPHNIALEGNGVLEEGEVVTDGGVSEVQADLEPGTYTFFCSVPGHREAGMAGELTVE